MSEASEALPDLLERDWECDDQGGERCTNAATGAPSPLEDKGRTVNGVVMPTVTTTGAMLKCGATRQADAMLGSGAVKEACATLGTGAAVETGAMIESSAAMGHGAAMGSTTTLGSSVAKRIVDELQIGAVATNGVEIGTRNSAGLSGATRLLSTIWTLSGTMLWQLTATLSANGSESRGCRTSAASQTGVVSQTGMWYGAGTPNDSGTQSNVEMLV
ncbi:uncharacterized protein LOC115649993 [Gopherus evgoodei]|uniref:uncharacterized protein LOC115649993 n=1 Tax=Gopherus evgoodei TaxID=1825980 RepID=UPI0011D01333|nr:uncharacterized protein LOC115649993 [Gopherus evgoodei]